MAKVERCERRLQSMLNNVKTGNYSKYKKKIKEFVTYCEIKRNGAVNQIKGIFRLGEVQKDYEFGIATDGLKWVFIDKNSKVVYLFDVTKELTK